MTLSEIDTVQQSLRSLAVTDRAAMGAVFYDKLFTDHPNLRRMFPVDMTLQHQKLVDMLFSIVAHLDKADNFRPLLIAMGKRHLVYGVKPFHYRMVGAALLFMLQQFLKNDYTRETKQAWLACFEEVSEIMQHGKTGE